MSTLALVEFLSLDGVMQGLGSPEEDTDGGFAHGGWGAPYAAAMSETTWSGTRILPADALDAVGELKATGDGDLVVLGSGAFARQLLAQGLVDELRLFLHPLLLGTGKRLFGELPAPRPLELRSLTSTTLGTIAAVYDLKS